MNYIEIRERALRKEIEEAGMLDNIPEDLFDLYLAVMLMFGAYVDERMVHDMWAIWRNKTNPYHKSLVKADKLSEEVLALDTPFVEIIHRAYRVAIELEMQQEREEAMKNDAK